MKVGGIRCKGEDLLKFLSPKIKLATRYTVQDFNRNLFRGSAVSLLSMFKTFPTRDLNSC